MTDVRRNLALAFLIAGLGACGECNCQAGEVSVGGVQVHEDRSVPLSFALDANYANEHGYTLPAKLSFELPRAKHEEIKPPKEQGIFLRVNYFADDGKATEDVLVTTFDTPPGPAEERLANADEFLKVKGVAAAMSGGGKLIGTQGLTVSGLPAVAGAGELEDPDLGTVFASVVVIPLPDTDTGIAIIGHHIAATSEIKTSDDVAKKGAVGKLLETLKIEPLGK